MGESEEDDDSSTASIASEENDTYDETTDSDFVPLSMGLDQVCLVSYLN